MKYRLPQIFYWTTEIAVVLVIVLWLKQVADRIIGPRPLVYTRLAIVWVPIIIAGFAVERYLAKDEKNRWAIIGLAVGGFVGLMLAGRFEFGYALHTWLHPDAAVNAEMTHAYGQRIGLFAGIFIGALLGGIASSVFKRPHEVASSK
jgi:hypothetical protein